MKFLGNGAVPINGGNAEQMVFVTCLLAICTWAWEGIWMQQNLIQLNLVEGKRCIVFDRNKENAYYIIMS